jgi:hypothetical protein
LCYKAEGRGSITDSAFGILLWHYPSVRTMGMGLPQRLTEIKSNYIKFRYRASIYFAHTTLRIQFLCYTLPQITFTNCSEERMDTEIWIRFSWTCSCAEGIVSAVNVSNCWWSLDSSLD